MQEMCKEAVQKDPYTLHYVPGYFKTRKICDAAVKKHPHTLVYDPKHLETQEMCNEAVCSNLFILHYVPDQYKTEEMGIKVMRITPLYFFLTLFPDPSGIKRCALKQLR